ncbi:MAG: DNA mismatch repair protein MutS [Ruminococcaceae bacterium]|nr:DNA mismatch repair protein MutS [Oscillospiraceae bacterium]
MPDIEANVTPMMKQYLDVKKKCPDCILFFRLGDFYEMFFDDAVTASRELELVLTGKDCGLKERAPMCGVPYHAALSYISKLISKGYKVAIGEQLEDPATCKGIVKRDIVRIYTPGTVVEDKMLEHRGNNYIMSIFEFRSMYGLAFADISTGQLYATSLTFGRTYNHLADEIARIAPAEIIINNKSESINKIRTFTDTISRAYVGVLPEEFFDYDLAVQSLNDNGCKQDELRTRAAGTLIRYMEDTQKMSLDKNIKVSYYKFDEYMAIDASSRRNLEISQTMRDKQKKGSLLWVIDKTVTSMGGRCLKRWIDQPLIDVDAINERLDAVSIFKEGFMLRSQLREFLDGIYDIERVVGRILLGTASPRDMVSLRHSLGKLPYIKETLSPYSQRATLLNTLIGSIDPLPQLHSLLEAAIVDDPPALLKDGGYIRAGYSAEVDQYREVTTNGKTYLASYEAQEREKTGIKNLKVSYNKVFGYYIEVTNSYKDLVPPTYIRKQTLVNNERYITDELKKMEDMIIGGEERLIRLESQLFSDVRDTAAGYADSLKLTADSLAILDTLLSFAEVADRNNYCKPIIHPQGTSGKVISIKDGRHPVVEQVIGNGEFVPNDVYINDAEDMMLVITGPNMAGKSTYMRQVALMLIMAQAGCFVPASEAEISIVDKLFTRVGASDDLASGQSTFMVEMSEVANILSNATENSFMILDEIGRGTSTFDGLSIAWAVLEYIVNSLKCRAMFATHYHELTELEKSLPAVKNYCVTVKKKGEDITFLHKIKRGGADGSYGISVASLAGIPTAVTARAKEILAQIDNQNIQAGKKSGKSSKTQISSDMDLLAYTANTVMQDEIIAELKEINVQELTPIEALNVLYRLHQKAEKRI